MRPRHTLAIGVTAAAGVTAATMIVSAGPTARLSPEAPTSAASAATPSSASSASRGSSAAPRPPASSTYTVPGGAGVDRGPVCGAAAGAEFPIETRLRGGPGSYRPGGGAGAWVLELTNTTDADCRHIHPVVVLVDRFRTLDVSRVTLEIADAKGRLRTPALEQTDEDEIIGVLDDGSSGFSVPAGRTVTVRARLAFATGTRPNEISATAATVQRRGDDSDWVGESNVYRFTVGDRG